MQKQESPLVTGAKSNLDLLITSDIEVELEEDSSNEEHQLHPPNPPNVKSVMEKSPFTADFRAVYHQAESEVLMEEHTDVNNIYCCTEIIDFLFDNYLGIFPLWSRILLGDLSRYAQDHDSKGTSKPIKTRDTNCHVEMWFWLVKNTILKNIYISGLTPSYIKCMVRCRAGTRSTF